MKMIIGLRKKRRITLNQPQCLLRKKKKGKTDVVPSNYFEVDYTQEAKELNVKGESNLRIYPVYGGIIEPDLSMPYSTGTVIRLREEGHSVVFLAAPHERPREIEGYGSIRSVLKM